MKYLFLILLLLLTSCNQSSTKNDTVDSIISISKLNFLTNSYESTSELSLFISKTKNQSIISLKNCDDSIFQKSIILPENIGEKTELTLETNVFNPCYGNSVNITIEKTSELLSESKLIYSVSIFGDNYKMYKY